MSKTYTIKDKQFTLASPTPKRIAALLQLYGKKKLSDLFTKDPLGSDEIKSIELDMRGDVDSTTKLMQICLADVEGLDAGDVDVRFIAGISQDFFSQLGEKLEDPQS